MAVKGRKRKTGPRYPSGDPKPNPLDQGPTPEVKSRMEGRNTLAEPTCPVQAAVKAGSLTEDEGRAVSHFAAIRRMALPGIGKVKIGSLSDRIGGDPVSSPLDDEKARKAATRYREACQRLGPYATAVCEACDGYTPAPDRLKVGATRLKAYLIDGAP
jgi:hypothetical protein